MSTYTTPTTEQIGQGKAVYGYEFTDNINFEVGYFMTGDIDIKHSIASGIAVEEAFSGSGFDYSV